MVASIEMSTDSGGLDIKIHNHVYIDIDIPSGGKLLHRYFPEVGASCSIFFPSLVRFVLTGGVNSFLI